MRITNHHNLPQALVDAIKADPYTSVGDISTTRLIDPPQLVQLVKRHDDEIEVDVTERMAATAGQGMHAVLERLKGNPRYIVEERYTHTVNGWLLTGQIDVYDREEEALYDYKLTKVYQLKNWETGHWTEQGNVNRWLMEKAGHKVKRLANLLFLKNWTPKDSKIAERDTVELELPLWPLDVAEEYINTRVKLHQQAAKLEDVQLPMCSD